MPEAADVPTKRICIVYTGGTMGSRALGNGLLAPAPLDEFTSKVNELAEAKEWPAELIVRPINGRLIDSASAIPRDWLRVRNVLEAEWLNYDGFVVVHGTDTMPYVAAFLSFAIEFQNKPVVVTGSMTPIFQEGDAASNLEASVQVALSQTLSGTPIDQVLICFGGRILRGNRATKLSLENDGVDTPRVDILGEYSGNTTLVQLRWNAGHPKRQVQPEGSLLFKSVTPSRVGIIRLFPGISVRMIRAMLSDLDGLVVEAYGSGTGPVGVREVLEARASQRMPIVVTTEVLKGTVQSKYETDLVRPGGQLISGGSMLAEAAFAKLYYLLGIAQGTREQKFRFVKERMSPSLRGEN